MSPFRFSFAYPIGTCKPHLLFVLFAFAFVSVGDFVSGLRAHRIVGNIGGRVKEGLRVVNVEITLNVQKLKINERRQCIMKKMFNENAQ
jgi:hypothetical protein